MEDLFLSCVLFAGIICGFAFFLVIWAQDRRLIERVFLAELQQMSRERDRYMSMIRSLSNKLVSSDIATFSAISEVEREEGRKRGEGRPARSDAVEAKIAAGFYGDNGSI